jgi:Leucine-rich repeat (LRR) protein
MGSLPPSLGTLRLKTLAVDDNALTGDLSTIRLMTPLKYLYAQNNSFTGNIFHGILMAQLPGLVEIDLSDNDLTAADIPSHIFSLPALRLFDASGNKITGTLPDAIPQNNVLEYLSFRGNTIGSSIPASITNLSKLSHLDLENNSLFGALPFAMDSMTSLQYLFLGNNSFETGAIPGELKELTALKELSLNNLGLKSNIPEWIGGLSHLTLLDLRENEFSGSIELVDFSKFQRLEYLMLNDNKLTGTIPEALGLIKSLKVLSLYHNSFTGSANPVCDAVSDIAWVGTDCSDDITCDCCDQCCGGDSCYGDAMWDELENNRWDHEYARAEYAFNPNILNGGIQPRDGSL